MHLPPALSRQAVVALVCGATIVTIAMGLRQGFGLLLRPIEIDLGVGREAFGLAIAIQNLMLGLAQPFVGAIADRWGAGRVAALGGLLYVAALAASATVSGALGLHLTLGFLLGLSMTGVTFVVVLGAVGRLVPPERRGMAFGIVTAGGSFGQFLLVPATQLGIEALGWRGMLLAGAGLAALMVPLARGIRSVQSSPGASRALPAGAGTLRDGLAEAARHPGYWLLNAGFFVCGFHIAFVSTHLPAFLADQGLDPAVGARALALVGLFNIIGSYVFGLSADRLRKRNVLAAIYLGRAVVFAVFLALPFTPLSATLFACAMGFLWLGTVPLTSGLVGQIFGVRHLSTLFGIVFMSHQIGAFCGAFGAGVAYRTTGSYDLVWAVSIGLGILAGLLNLPIPDRRIERTAAA